MKLPVISCFSLGSMQLWNIKSLTLIYSFAGWKSRINVLVQSPALDVIGIGLNSGKILLHNIKTDETIITFIQDWGSVTNLSFCTENSPIMVSGTKVGHIVFWDLEERKVATQQLKAHSRSVTGLQYLPNEQLIVSSSSDNSLKMWLFDPSRTCCQLVRLREGHKASPTFIRFYDTNGKFILSAGSDGYLRAFNTETEIANKNLGKAFNHSNKRNLNNSNKDFGMKLSSKKLPISQFTSETTRENDWDNIVAIHTDTALISTWSFDKCKFCNILSRRHEEVASFKKLYSTSIFLTHCGNFVVVGYSSGFIDKFNVQSGMYRGSYGDPKAHDGYVNGIFVSDVNHLMVTGATDHLLKFWSFKYQQRPCLYKLDVKEVIILFRSHEESSLLAVALENFTILIVDVDCKTVIRKFSGHCGQINDMTFSPDCRWLISVSMDSTLKTWDIPAAKCIDIIQLDKPCISVTFHPNSAYIATAHVDCLGITLWSNRCLFSLVSLKSVEPFADTMEISDNDESEDSLITFLTDKNLPMSSAWSNILNIDAIRQRNKLKELPKVEEAPFILPTVPSVHIKFDLSNVEKDKREPSDRIIKPYKLETMTEFSKILLNANDTGDFVSATDMLKTFSLSAVVFEINSLSPENGGSIKLMLKFMKMLEIMFKSKKCFEIASSFLAQFLKAHTTLLIEEPELTQTVESLSELHDECWKILEQKLLYGMSISKFFIKQ